VSHFGWELPKFYRKLPHYGWYALSKLSDITFNAIDLFAYNQSNELKNDNLMLMSRCYRYYIQEHPDLLEVPMKYSESIERDIINDYFEVKLKEKFWKLARQIAQDGMFMYHGKPFKLPDLLNELGMPQFWHSGIGQTTYKLINYREFDVLRLHNGLSNKIIIPTFFAPNNRIATLEIFELGDLSKREMIWRYPEPGWYGKIGTNIVGSIRDLMTNEGCTWTPKILPWVDDQILHLHESLQPNQCVEIWSSLDTIATDKNPLTLIKTNDLEEQIKGSLGKLSRSQLKELEKVTGRPLLKAWLSSKTSEVSIGGTRFIQNNDRYYYYRGKNVIEYTNFAIQLTKITKEGNDFIQHGVIIKDGDAKEFSTKRIAFTSQDRLIKAMTRIMLEAGIGTPSIAPNLKHYITNIIDAFNPINPIQKDQIENTKKNLDEL
jgi:hypothetical protein